MYGRTFIGYRGTIHLRPPYTPKYGSLVISSHFTCFDKVIEYYSTSSDLLSRKRKSGHKL